MIASSAVSHQVLGRGADLPRRLLAAFALFALILAGACSRPAERPAHAAPPAQSPPPAPTPAVKTPPAPEGADFSKEVRLLYRVVACGGDEPVAPLDAGHPSVKQSARSEEHTAV